MEFINIVPGRFMGGTVDRHPVPYLILDDEHPDLFQLFSQLLNVKADNPVIDIHVCPVVKHIQ